MKPLMLILALMPLLASAQQRISLRGRNGEMVLENIESLSTRVTGADTRHFKANGKKLHGSWSSLNLSLTASSLEGDAIQSQAGLSLQKATVSGGVHLRMLRGEQEIEADCQTAIITSDGEIMHINMEGAVTLDSRAAKSGQTMHATGSSGNIDVLKQTGMGKGTLQGPVRVEMNRRLANGSLAHLISHSKRLDINHEADPATITLTGDVSIQGNDPALSGDMRAGRVVITLDATGQPIGMDATGEPGVTRVKDRRTGGSA